MTRSPAFDVAVIGLGVMGGAATLHLARRGLRVLGIDQHSPPHDLGSSHGHTRLIREAYHEHPLYVPLVRRAFELWRDLQATMGGAGLLQRTGSVMIGDRESPIVAGTLESALRHGIVHELLDAASLHRRFPGLQPLDDQVGVFEPGAAVLSAERVVSVQLEHARRAHATLQFGERVHGWEPVLGGVEVRTERESYVARQLVLCAGAWSASLLPPGTATLTVERQVQAWWEPARLPDLFTAGRMPVTMWHLRNGSIFYTMPDCGQGVKVGWHHSGQVVDADTVDRTVSLAEHASIADLLRRFLPLAKGARVASSVCLYTNTPDGHFIVDRLPGQDRVWLVSACSGHGFKFASVMGEVVTDMVTTGASAFDLTPFRLSRFASP